MLLHMYKQILVLMECRKYYYVPTERLRFSLSANHRLFTSYITIYQDFLFYNIIFPMSLLQFYYMLFYGLIIDFIRKYEKMNMYIIRKLIIKCCTYKKLLYFGWFTWLKLYKKL